MDEQNVLVSATESLNAARNRAKYSRIGAGNPRHVLLDLMSNIQSASNAFDENRAYADADTSFLIDYEIMKANLQFLSLSEYLPVLPKDDHSDWSEIESQTIKARMVKISDLVKNLLIAPENHPIKLELQAIYLETLTHFAGTLNEGRRLDALKQIAGYARKLLAQSKTVSRGDDPGGYAAWSQLEAMRILEKCGELTPADYSTILELPNSDMGATWDALGLSLTKLRLGGSAELIESELSNIQEIAEELGDSPDSMAGLRARLLIPFSSAASDAADNNDIHLSQKILDVYLSVQGMSAPDCTERATLFLGSSSRIFCLLRQNERLSYVQAPVPMPDLLGFIDSSESGDIEKMPSHRKKLAKALRPISQVLAQTNAQSLVLCPIGLCSWIPWHTLPTGLGGHLLSLQNVRWMKPKESLSCNSDSSSPEGSSLLIDISFSESEAVICTWLKCGFSEERVYRFSSEDELDLTSDDFLSVLENSDRVIYYGHSSSDPIDFKNSAFVLGKDELLTGEQIEYADLRGLRELVLISCEGGRDGLFLSGVSPATFASRRGVHTVVSTLWQIYASDGLQYIQELLPYLQDGYALEDAWYTIGRSRVTRARTPFSCSF